MFKHVEGMQVGPPPLSASGVAHEPPLQIWPSLAQSWQVTPPVPHVLADVTVQLP
jgi:hypothetical protein